MHAHESPRVEPLGKLTQRRAIEQLLIRRNYSALLTPHQCVNGSLRRM
jgi:hypothetical protein